MNKITILHFQDKRWYALVAKTIQHFAIKKNQKPINHSAFTFYVNGKKKICEIKLFYNLKISDYDKAVQKYKGTIVESEIIDLEIPDNLMQKINRLFNNKKYGICRAIGSQEVSSNFFRRYKIVNKIMDCIGLVNRNSKYIFCSELVNIFISKILAKDNKNNKLVKAIRDFNKKYTAKEMNPADLYDVCIKLDKVACINYIVKK